MTIALHACEPTVPPRPCTLQAGNTGRHYLRFLRESKSLQILFHGLESNWFFVFSSISILIEGQYLLHLENTGYIKIWKGRLSIVMYKPEGTAYATQEDCSCITGVLVLAHG